MDRGAGIVDFGRAWKAVRALVDNWRSQDYEGAQVVDAVCAGLTQSAEFQALAQRQSLHLQQQYEQEQEQSRHLLPQTHLPMVISPLQNNVGRVSNVLELFPGVFERLRFKALAPVVSRYFDQLEAMLRVFEDTMRSMDLVLQQVQDMVYGHALDSPKSQRFSENDDDEPHVLSYKAERTLRQPVSDMDHLDFCEKITFMYRTELVRKKVFLERLKSAVTSSDFAWPFDQHQTKPKTKQSNVAKEAAHEDQIDAAELRATFASWVPQLWSTETSSTSKVDQQVVSEIFAKVLVKL